MRIVGHDPGVTGGLVLIEDGEAVEWLALKRVDGRIDAAEVYSWLVEMDAHVMVSEKVRGLPQDTPTTAWVFSGAEAAVVAAAQIADVKVVYVTPQRWQKALFQRLPRATRKERISSAFAFARRRQPAMEEVLKLKKNDGLASAVCIAEFGWRLHNHNKLQNV